MTKLSIRIFLLVFLSACTPKDYFRTTVANTPCELNKISACSAANLVSNKEDDYTLGFVEIDDQGQFYDNGQVESLITLLKNQQQPQYVTIYVHGWHHNADDNDFNVRRFKETLKDTKQRNPGYHVIGIYVGWRGETVTVPWLRALTFWDRKLVSEEVGRNSLLDFLLRVETVVKAEGKNKLLTVGHSLGASVIFNSLHQVLLARLAQPENANLRTGFGDLVVLVNPAFEAMRFAAIREAAQRYNREYPFSEKQKPLLIIATSESDSTTKTAFSWVRTLTALFEQHRTITPDSRQEADDSLPFSEWDLDTTAVGHFNPFITHRLEAHAPVSPDNACAWRPGWLNSVVVRRKKIQFDNGERPTGEGWDTGDELPSVFKDAAQMTLRHLKNSATYDPYWVIQTNKTMIPNHGFINQKQLWCFIDLTMKDSKYN
jgi:hypothetical protein